MSLSVGIIGLPNVGKSTLFNALLKKRVALSANYPFATIEPNIGVVAVPDERLEKLAELVAVESTQEESEATSGVLKRPPVVPAIVQFVDIAGLVKGASTGAGLGNKFLSHIREVDAIVQVVRDFEDENVVREGSENPEADRLTIETELGLADLQSLEKIQNPKEKVKNENSRIRNLVIEKVTRVLNEGKMASQADLTDEEKEAIKDLNLLTIKPMLYVYNVSEGRLGKEFDGYCHRQDSVRSVSFRIDGNSFADRKPSGDATRQTLSICAKLEEELADYSDEERKEYLKSVGIEQTGLERLIIKAYDLLGLISFLTAGKKEVRAWTIQQGTKAPQAAGVIHTDFIKNFIRAQVIPYEKLIEAGSHAAAKEKGWIRTEGKEYVMQDGDVVEFLVGS